MPASHSRMESASTKGGCEEEMGVRGRQDCGVTTSPIACHTGHITHLMATWFNII